MRKYTRVYAAIDLDAIKYNMESMRSCLGPDTGMLGVVKADGYGHGAIPVARAIEPYVEGYAVATVEEAMNLRHHHIDKMILILGVTHKGSYQELIDYDIRPAIFTVEQAAPLSELAASQGKKAKIHLVVDTGMSRIGMSPDENGAEIAAQIAAMPGIEIEGMFSHFAKADETDKSNAELQTERYLHFRNLLKERGIKIRLPHIANSAGIIDLPQSHFHLTRAGISIYGLYPSDEVDRTKLKLKPAMELKSFVTYVKTVPAGTEVSYGGTFVTEKETVIATVSAGYGDGYPRALSNRGYVLIHGKKAPILGRVCMDQCMVDVTSIPDVAPDTEVTLVGRDGDEQITVEDLAAWIGGFHYELICDFGKRIPRVYYKDGAIVGSKDYFEDEYKDFLL